MNWYVTKIADVDGVQISPVLVRARNEREATALAEARGRVRYVVEARPGALVDLRDGRRVVAFSLVRVIGPFYLEVEGEGNEFAVAMHSVVAVRPKNGAITKEVSQ